LREDPSREDPSERYGRATRARYRIGRGLDVPVGGSADARVEDGPPIASVALVPADARVLETSLAVHDGQAVRVGEKLFEDRANPGVVHASPATGVVRIMRDGERDEPSAIVVEVAEGETEAPIAGDADVERAPEPANGDLDRFDREELRRILLRSGLWTSFRTRPFGRIPTPDATPAAVLVRAIDTDPLAASPRPIIEAHRESFRDGLVAVTRLVDCPTYICTAPATDIPTPSHARLKIAEFDGPHPAGLVGTHVHFLVPAVGVATGELAPAIWHIGYQDVIAIGKLLRTGRPWTERIVALAGPGMRRPRLVRTRLGASTSDLLGDALIDGECRVISGSVLSGRTASGSAAYLGRYHAQVSVLLEQRARAASEPEARRRAFSYFRARHGRLPVATGLGSITGSCSTTALHGRPGAMVAVEAFEQVTPLDLPIAPLLRALVVGDVERARKLGCTALEEEDLALCTFVCPAKIDYGRHLRAVLDVIEGGG